MSTEKKIITVFGATGKQGGSVARSLIQNPAFHVRGITRNPTSPAAEALKALGIEVVKANGFNSNELKAAFSGAWGAFVNTNSDDPECEEGTREVEQGKIIMDAAISSGVKHMVYSSLVSSTEAADFPIPVFDNKNAIEQYVRSLPFVSSSFIYAAWFYENQLDKDLDVFFGGFPHTEDEEGYVTLKLPHWGDEEDVAFIGIEDDFGDIVHGIFLDPEEYNGKIIHGASSEMDYPEFVRIFGEVTGKKTRYIEIPHEQVPTFGVRLLEEIAMIYKFAEITGGKYNGEPLDLKTPEKLKKKVQKVLGKEEKGLTTWGEFVKKHLDNFVGA